jgi:hypothetical protein
MTLQKQLEHTAPPHTVTENPAAKLAITDTQPLGARDLFRLAAQMEFLRSIGAIALFMAGADPPQERRRCDRHRSVRLWNRNALSIRKTYGTVRRSFARISMTTEGQSK